MLATLTKYEFKAVGRILLPLYGAWLIASIMLGLSINNIFNIQSGFFIVITSLLYGFVSVAAVVITTIILIQRFYKNLLGNEGYFMFALPVSTGSHIANKVISAAVWMFIGIIAAILSGFAIILCVEGIRPFFEEAGIFIGGINLLDSEWLHAIVVILEFLIIILVGCAMVVTKVYAAISVGHQWSNHRVLGAILAYIVFGIIESILMNIFNAITSLDFVGRIFLSFGDLPIMAQTHLIMWGVIAVLTAITAVYWLVSWVLLDNKLNLE